MDIQATKIELAKMILDIEDSSLLEKVRNLIAKEKKDFYDGFSEGEKLEIRYGIDQLDSGKSISWKDFKTQRGR